jgi:hypothetical protein
MTDKNIKRFQFEIQTKDSGDFIKRYDELVRMYTGIVRDEGYVRVLDLDPHLSVEYNETKDVFNYVLTIQTVYVGKKQAECTEAILNGKYLTRNIPEAK